MNNQEFLRPDDQQAVKRIAENYNLTVRELGRLLTKSQEKKGMPFSCRFSQGEIKVVDNAANLLRLSRGKFCVEACRSFLESEDYKTVSTLEFRSADMEAEGARNVLVCIRFQNASDYVTLKKLCEEHAVSFSTLLRYCALRYSRNAAEEKFLRLYWHTE